MALRKALSYSKHYARPYTRVSRAKSKSYIKVVPHNKVAKYTMGDAAAFSEGRLPFRVLLIAEENIQIRDNALESGRMYLSKELDEKIAGQYYCEIKAHPHHILRNNKTAAGAGADRISTGMKQSFGIIEGRAAMLGKGHSIYLIACATEDAARMARNALQAIKAKMPCKTKVMFEKVAVKLIA